VLEHQDAVVGERSADQGFHAHMRRRWLMEVVRLDWAMRLCDQCSVRAELVEASPRDRFTGSLLPMAQAPERLRQAQPERYSECISRAILLPDKKKPHRAGDAARVRQFTSERQALRRSPARP